MKLKNDVTTGVNEKDDNTHTQENSLTSFSLKSIHSQINCARCEWMAIM